MDRQRILFVDDEQNILQGLRRMLRPLRGEWDLSFAISGEEAMGELMRSPHDIVVTDMRMPGMSGADLLRWVAVEHPDTLRIILSGQADEEGILRSVGPAQQFLSKPCEPEMLIDTVRRASHLRDLLAAPELRQLVKRLGTLPSMPAPYTELVEELQAPEPSSQRIGELISSDLAISSKVLQLVNSAFSGVPREVTSPMEAVRLLGLSTLRSLVLAAGAFASVTVDGANRLLLERLWNQSLAVGTTALRIIEMENGSSDAQDAAVSAGLLHDIGALTLFTCIGDDYEQLVREAAAEGIALADAERVQLGATHAELGAYLLGTWGIPIPVVEVVAHHHQPAEIVTAGFGPLTAVHVAAGLAGDASGSCAGLAGQIDEQYLKTIGKLERLPAWRSGCGQAAGQASA